MSQLYLPLFTFSYLVLEAKFDGFTNYLTAQCGDVNNQDVIITCTNDGKMQEAKKQDEQLDYTAVSFTSIHQNLSPCFDYPFTMEAWKKYSILQ